MRIEMAESGHGRRVVVKRAESVEEAARVRREADLLEVATHPGLVELIGFDDGAEPVVRTGQIDGTSLEEGGPFDVEEVAGVVAGVACIVADLHDMGLVHGAVVPAHVLIGSDGRPVLCGLGYGGLVGEPISQRLGTAEEFVDPSRADAAVLDPSGDVFGVGALILHLLGGRPRGAGQEALRSVASRATALDVATRPTARQLADAAHDAVASPRLPRLGAATAPAASASLGAAAAAPLEGWRRTLTPPQACRRMRARTVAVLVFAAASVAGTVAFVVRVPSHPASVRAQGSPTTTVTAATAAAAAAVVTTAAPVATTAAPTTSVAVAARPARPAPSGCAPVDGPLAADVNGDGCPETVRFADGVVVAGPLRWAIGEPGGETDDDVAVGDWACSGGRTLAVLRPGTGEVFAFAGWASAGQDIDAPLVGTVSGGRRLRAADLDGDGCNELIVERTSGAPVVLRAPRARP